MMAAVLDHLWQSTLFAFGAALLAMAFARARAAVRYGVWLAASAKFLVPFAALAALGRLAAPAMRPPAEANLDAAFVERAVQPFSPPHAMPSAAEAAGPLAHAVRPAIHATAGFDPASILLGVWVLGSAAVLVVWLTRWSRIHAAVRAAAPLDLCAPMPVLASSWMPEPGLVGLWRPVLLVPDSLRGRLGERQFEALLAHEACHLRRRDNLTAVVHMLVEALFWFHPLVWWIGARLMQEREHACDEAVVQSGHDRAAYATSLVECARLCLQAPLPCVSGASGSNLTRRVEAIMTAPRRSPLSRPCKAVLVAAGACALATPVAAGWLASPTVKTATARVVAIAAHAVALRPDNARRQPDSVSSPDQGEDTPPVTLAQAAAAPATQDAAPPSGRTEPSPGAADAARRWIEKTQLHQSDDDDMSPAMAKAARQQQTLVMPTIGAFGPLQAAPAPNLDVSKPALILVRGPDPAAAPGHHSPDLGGDQSLLADPVWVRRPTLEAIDRVYPAAADRQRLPGRATMRCHADERGYLSRCAVVSERPEGVGFGKAALFLQTEFKLRTLDGTGTPVQGHLVDVPVDFTPRFWAKIAGDAGGQVVRWTTDPLVSPYGKARYPWEAMQKGVAGHVTLNCVVQPDGHLGDCEVARESPKGLGFGRMALLSKTQVLKVETRAADGSPMAGRRVEVDYVFNPPCDAMADRDQIPCGYGRGTSAH